MGNDENKKEWQIMSGVSNPYRYQYETVAASATAQVLGGTGAGSEVMAVGIFSA